MAKPRREVTPTARTLANLQGGILSPPRSTEAWTAQLNEWREAIDGQDLQRLTDIGRRFQGVDLSYRSKGTNWEKRWRAECFSARKVEARVVVFGDTAAEAITALMARM